MYNLQGVLREMNKKGTAQRDVGNTNVCPRMTLRPDDSIIHLFIQFTQVFLGRPLLCQALV